MGVEQDPELGVQAEKPPNPHQHGWRKRKPRRATERYLEYLQNWANVLISLIALPDGLRYREMRVSLTYEVARGACCPCQRAGRLSSPRSPCQACPANSGSWERRDQSTGRCNPLWEEKEMALQRKIHPRIYTQERGSHALLAILGFLPCSLERSRKAGCSSLVRALATQFEKMGNPHLPTMRRGHAVWD